MIQNVSMFIEKSPKRFIRRNLAHVGMVQCMNALADLTKYKNRMCHAHRLEHDMHSITCMATLFNNYPYISSSKFSAN